MGLLLLERAGSVFQSLIPQKNRDTERLAPKFQQIELPGFLSVRDLSQKADVSEILLSRRLSLLSLPVTTGPDGIHTRNENTSANRSSVSASDCSRKSKFLRRNSKIYRLSGKPFSRFVGLANTR